MVKYSMKIAKQPSNVYFQLAKRNLERKAVRTLLAALGIIIGVVAISSMGILGNCLKVSVSNSFEDFNNEIIVSPAIGETAITENQVKQLNKINGIESVIPVHLDSTKIEFKDKSDFCIVYGIESEDLISLVEIDDGKMLKIGSTDCVIGSDIANSLDIKVGEKITLEDTKLKVTGILKKRGITPDIGVDTSIFVNPEVYIKIFDDKENEYDYVIVKAKSVDNIDNLEHLIEKRFNKKEDKVSLASVKNMMISLENISKSISLFLMGISSISLVVAGVSVLNVMLMSVLERTKEIGIMRAVGASKDDIMKMFILESLILGMIASFIGGLLSFGIAIVVTGLALKNVSLLFDWDTFLYIIAGIGFGIITSLIGGIYPASKASKMKPIDSLKYE